jgi:hypothetical protein
MNQFVFSICFFFLVCMQIEHEPMSINMTIICYLFYFGYCYLVPNIVIPFKVWQLFLT